MKLLQSYYLPNLQPPLTNKTNYNTSLTTSYYSPTTKFTTISNSLNPISISAKPCKLTCLCTSTEDSYTNSSTFDVELDDTDSDQSDGVVINIVKSGKRSRRIDSCVVINAGFQVVWSILTDYERLSDFIPALAVSRLLHKTDNYARLFQIGEQNLAFGFKFNAKAVLDCYEKDLEILAYGNQRRDIDFKMVEGDFDIFEGKWLIEEYDAGKCEDSQVVDLMKGTELGTILSYVVEVKPKPWLPVGLIEDRLCKEIKTNLCCVREEAHLRVTSSCSQELN